MNQKESKTSGSFTLSLCVLNQWALDFNGNMARVIESIKLSKKLNARYRLGPELELSGYGCEDHFNELDTYTHSWQCLSQILKETNANSHLRDIVCDIGMPVLHDGSRYNCRVLILNGQILLIRPKMVLPDKGLHRETRWFTAWPHRMKVVKFNLPECISEVARDYQSHTMFGDAIICFSTNNCDNLHVGLETCEELWTDTPPHIQMYASGVDVVLNGSASHHELRKLQRRINLVKMASRTTGGLYAYTNLLGCDSERIYYDGCAVAALSGSLVCLTKQFGLGDMLVQTVTVDLHDIEIRRLSSLSHGRPVTSVEAGTTLHAGYPVIHVDFSIRDNTALMEASRAIIDPHIISPEEEIAQGPALWLWDMLRRSRSSGFFLCLSGGLDSASVACLLCCLCQQIYTGIKEGVYPVATDCRRILGEVEDYVPTSVRELCGRLCTTCYLGTENSSQITRSRARRLADSLGFNHLECDITGAVSELVNMSTKCLQLNNSPRFASRGGTQTESLALQNVQARTRMVSAYLLAQLLPVKCGLPSGLLVLGTGNLDECLRGYLTKYDCSSADLNPIGSISKSDLRRFLVHCSKYLPNYMSHEHSTLFTDVMSEILSATPTAELMPLEPNGAIQQSDEEDMGITYDELSLFGKLRKISSCGPYSMVMALLGGDWNEIRHKLPANCLDSDGNPTKELGRYLSNKVKHFFRYYAINRHKATVLPPACHAESYNADDNRFDLRPFLYPADWTHQFHCVDTLVSKWEEQLAL